MSIKQKVFKGERSNKLTAIEFVGIGDKQRYAKWLCQCDCGKQIILESRRFRIKLSCGCVKIKKTRGKTRLKYQPSDGTKYASYWAKVRKSFLPVIPGKKVSNLDYIGKKFNGVYPICRVGNKFECLCSCGTKLLLTPQAVKAGRKSCQNCKNLGKRYESISNLYFHSIKNCANQRGLDFKITPKDIMDLWNRKSTCSLSGIELSLGDPNNENKGRTASLDRIDSCRGYYSDNIQWVWRPLNKIKRSLADSKFIEYCHLVSSPSTLESVVHIFNKNVITDIKRRAKKSSKEFNLDAEYCEELLVRQNYKCALTGLPIDASGKIGCAENASSVDRIDSSKGYVKGNIQLVHKDINLMRWDNSIEDFKEMCRIVSEYNKPTIK